MGNDSSKLIACIEDNTVCARGTTAVDGTRAQDWEFIVSAADGEIEAFIVVVNVWVGIGSVTSRVQFITSGFGRAHGAASVTDAAASVCAGAALEIIWEGKGAGEEEGGKRDDLEIAALVWNVPRRV